MAKVSGENMRSGPENILPPESWLPPGWVVQGKVRQSGVLAGRTDKYYIEPTTGQRFTSKVGVLNYLKTGVVPTKKKATDNASAIKDSGESSSGKKHMKSSSRSKPKTFKFDFSNVPEKMEWVSTDTYMDRWTPFTGDEKVAESLAQEWNAAFAYLVVGSGYPTF